MKQAGMNTARLLQTGIGLYMRTELSSFEHTLTAKIPCSAARFSVWYSRWWRTTERRPEALFILAIALALIIGAAAFVSLRASQPDIALSDTAKASIATFLFIIGFIHGTRTLLRFTEHVNSHWLAWTLDSAQRARERRCALLIQLITCISMTLSLATLITPLVAVSTADVAIATSSVTFGFLGSMRFSKAPGIRNLLGILFFPVNRLPRPNARTQHILLALQSPAPLSLAAVAVSSTLAMSGIAIAIALREEQNLVLLGAFLGLVSLAFCLTLLRPGAAALHGLLAWTRTPMYKVLGPLILLPMLLATIFFLPLIGAALWLHWFGLAIMLALAPALAAYVCVIWLLADLSRVQGRRAQTFAVAHSAVLAVALATGPGMIILLPLQLFWLLREGNNFWRTSSR